MKHVRPLLLASIAAFAPACLHSSTEGCDPPERDFTIDGELTEEEVTDLQTAYSIERDQIDCETACRFLFERESMWQLDEVETCSGEISPVADPDLEHVAGDIRCTGHAFEYYCEGRRPTGHVELVAEGDGLADHLARCAYLEAAAVTAFDDLVDALERWHAPAQLVARCRRARAQEIEHARDVGALAMQHGATLTSPTREPRELSPLELAIDNAIEGCVHEAWAALRAQWMAEHAHDESLRALYAKIAADECEHAQLSWDLHAWLLASLDEGDRERVAKALRGALDGLPRIAAAQAHANPAVLGLPDAATSFALARDFRDRLAA
jgi:hypothetical protein